MPLQLLQYPKNILGGRGLVRQTKFMPSPGNVGLGRADQPCTLSSFWPTERAPGRQKMSPVWERGNSFH
jgi:hypothetical protein